MHAVRYRAARQAATHSFAVVFPRLPVIATNVVRNRSRRHTKARAHTSGRPGSFEASGPLGGSASSFTLTNLKALAASGKPFEWRTYDGLGHGLSPAIWDDVTSWVLYRKGRIAEARKGR